MAALVVEKGNIDYLLKLYRVRCYVSLVFYVSWSSN